MFFRSITESLPKYLPQIIELSELIQGLNLSSLRESDTEDSFQSTFFSKVKSWYESIPKEVAQKYEVTGLLDTIELSLAKLQSKPRHGDFTPWHIIELPNDKLGLIDGEHAKSESVEYYDICYFIRGFLVYFTKQTLLKRCFPTY